MIRYTAFLILLLVKTTVADSQLRASRGLDERDIFTSYFDVTFLTEGGIQYGDVELAAQALATSYNDLVGTGYENPYDQRMEKVEVVDPSTGRKLSNLDHRDLQVSGVRLFLLTTGSCTGCASSTKFTLQLSGRNRNRVLKTIQTITTKGSKDTSKGSKGIVDKGSKGVTSKGSKGITSKGSKGITSKGSKGATSEGSEVEYKGTLPTEEEVRLAYATEIQSLDISIVDIGSLTETKELPWTIPSPTASPVSGKAKGGKSKGGKDGKDAKSSKASKQSKSKGTKSTPVVSEKLPKKKNSEKSALPPPPTCPPVEAVGSYTGTYTSYFESLYSAILDSDVGLDVAVPALVIAYNRVMEKYAAEVIMQDAAIYDTESRRRLSFAEAESRRTRQRDLQVSLNTYLIIAGWCTACSREFTYNNQITGRRRQLYESLDCPLPGLPEAEEVREEYNIVLEELKVENIQTCEYLAEISQPKLSSKSKGSRRGRRGLRLD